MKITLAVSVLLASLAACGMAHAEQYMDALALSAAATGDRFTSGQDRFRMLPGSVVSDPLPPGNAESGAARSARTQATTVMTRPIGKIAARVGPYAVLLDTPANAARGVRAASTERKLAAAVNERTGRVVLVRPQLKLTGTTPTNATALASSSGGRIVYTSTVDHSAVIAYASVEQAQRALTSLQGNTGATQFSLVVSQAVMQPM
ncbi:hypothetical protein A7D16_11680 [Xanthomonas nasturtii]|uniref:hypothetical protein n=1 Tax=Xanthomonas nasturtii TaxID=1843581 RepID=UPI0007E38EFB|nr:hypothetical protein [Xanthomonas nasturtii]OAX88425.1 hypothetical protein A7D16_11680 [Xanthomonas nasturtii]WVL55461.1 hypothetical protein M3O54_013565 [Xanthomonas nasturtii]